MRLVYRLLPAWAATMATDERGQRLTLAWRIGCVRWPCIIVSLMLDRTPLTPGVCLCVAFYNLSPFAFAPRYTTRQLRLLGGVTLLLDVIALMLVSLPMLRRGGYPVILLIIFFEASMRFGFEPPCIAVPGMAALTAIVVGFEAVALK